jgi:hypothetical protein
MGIRRPWVLLLVLLIGFLSARSVRAQSPAKPDSADAGAAVGSNLSPALLTDLPTSENIYQVLETMEGEVTSDRFYGGGLNTGRPARNGAFLNSWTQTQFFVGDVNVTVPNGGAPFLFPSTSVWDRVQVGTALMSPAFNAAGFAVGLQPARPATTWTRVIEGSVAGSGLVAQPSTSVAGPIETLNRWTQGSLLVTGPLSPRLGLMAAVQWAGAGQVERTGLKQAEGQAGSVFANLVYTPTPRDEVRTVGWVQRTQAPFAGALAFHEPLAADQTTFTHIQTTWERQATNAGAWRIYGAYSEAAGSRADATPGAPVVERLSDGPVPLLVDSGDRTDRQWSFGTRATTAPRRHTLFAGADVGQASARIGPGFVGTIAELVDGNRARMWQYTNPGSDSHRHATTVLAFVSDRIVLGPGRTLDAGVSYDGVNGSADQAATGISWRNVLPRVELRFKRSPASFVTYVVGYRRAADRLTLDTLAVGDPFASTAFVSRWTAQGVGPMVARMGPGTGGDPTFSAIDPSLSRPTTDEVIAGVDVQLTPGIRGRITGVARRTKHLFNLVDTGAPISSYTMSTVIDGRPAADGGDVPLPVFNRLPSSFGADRYLLTNNPPGDTADAWFEGLVLNAEASVGRLAFLLNATASQTDGPANNLGFHADENDLGGVGELFADPNATASARGRLFYDRAFTLKMSAVYQFPSAITFGAIARYQDGQPFSRVTVVPDLNQGTEFVRAYPAGDARFMFTGTLDLRFQKAVRIGAAGIGVFVDAYNVLNMGNEVEEHVVTGYPAFRDITAIQPPLTVHVGLRLRF